MTKKDKERIIQTFIGVLTQINDKSPATMRELVKFTAPCPEDTEAMAIIKEEGEDTEREGMGMINIMSKIMKLLTDESLAVRISLPDDHNSVIEGFCVYKEPDNEESLQAVQDT
jgi:hypothetical protein